MVRLMLPRPSGPDEVGDVLIPVTDDLRAGGLSPEIGVTVGSYWTA